MPTARPLDLDIRCRLGEGPTWDPEGRVAHMVDIDEGVLWEISFGIGEEEPRAVVVLRLRTTLGAAVHSDDGGFLLAQGQSLQHVDLNGRLVREIPVIAPGTASRLNDGAVDREGRYLVGSLALDGRSGQEHLWQLDHDGSLRVLDDDLNLSNGLGWSPDGSVLYSVDSVPGAIWARDYDADTGRCGVRHRLLTVVDGTPDGLAVDEEGNLWVAIWGRGEIRGYRPDGRQTESISVGPPHTTSCAFAGPALQTLLITTAGRQVGSTPPTPWCGRIFVADMAVSGRPTTAWRHIA